MKRRYGFIFAIFGFIVFFFSTESQAEEWILFSRSPLDSFAYYDKQNIKLVSKDVVQVWTKISYSEKDAQDWIKKWGPIYKDLNYTIALREYNCSEKKSRTLLAAYYNQKGGLIVNYCEPTAWCSVVPENMDETLFNIVCKSPEENEKKNEGNTHGE